MYNKRGCAGSVCGGKGPMGKLWRHLPPHTLSRRRPLTAIFRTRAPVGGWVGGETIRGAEQRRPGGGGVWRMVGVGRRERGEKPPRTFAVSMAIRRDLKVRRRRRYSRRRAALGVQSDIARCTRRRACANRRFTTRTYNRAAYCIQSDLRGNTTVNINKNLIHERATGTARAG